MKLRAMCVRTLHSRNGELVALKGHVYAFETCAYDRDKVYLYDERGDVSKVEKKEFRQCFTFDLGKQVEVEYADRD